MIHNAIYEKGQTYFGVDNLNHGGLSSIENMVVEIQEQLMVSLYLIFQWIMSMYQL